MSSARPQFSIDDAFELTLEDAGPGPESSGVARFGPLHFERRARFEVADEDKQSRLRYQNLENDEDGAQASPEPDGGVSTRDSGHTSIRSSQWSFSTISSSTQRSYNACCSWTQHPLIQKNRRVVLASFLLLLLGLGVSSAIFFVPGILLLVPGGLVKDAPGALEDCQLPTAARTTWMISSVSKVTIMSRAELDEVVPAFLPSSLRRFNTAAHHPPKYTHHNRGPGSYSQGH
ncbi:transmembrane protein 134 isoform X2 [Grammomys surdaster]|uniref:transmembrane protein 134 isoform X2 n=1 Tax=Grammomys surdaster TaxID=491861 RepID=UPI0010A0BA8D|nr:transmembrane protein 134 isoform X2 [Grammomys surdaster]